MNSDPEEIDQIPIFRIPSRPGNYPEDLLLRVKPLLDSNPGNHGEVYRSLHVPKKANGIMLAADIRNFTKTLENQDTLKVQHFVDQFF